jgi:hypothetical protein
LKQQLFILLLFLFQVIPSLIAQDLFINEIMSSNENNLADEDGDFSDWIEIYNASDASINLEGWTLSDDENELDQWAFPNANISANGFILVFASGKDRINTAEFHTNFKIKSEGEALFLSNPNGLIIDELDAVAIPTDLSFGRKNDASNNLFYFNNPSPNASNNDNSTTIIPTETLAFSHEAAWYETGFDLMINGSSNHIIRYTTDGSTPTILSAIFEESIPIHNKENIPNQISMIPTSPEYWEVPRGNVFKITTIRAASFLDNQRSSPIYSRSFLLHPSGHDRYSVPVISLSTDNDFLFDNEDGIHVFGEGNMDIPQEGNYYETGGEWEIPVHFEYFGKEGELHLNQDVGMRIHGVFSRQLPQKSLRIYARDEYGESYFNYPFFEQKPAIERYKRLVIRSVNPNYFHVPFKDELCHLLANEIGLPYQAYEPTVVFINGEYWGVFNLKERQDEYYVASNFDIDKDDINLIEKDGDLVSGDVFPFWELKAFVKNNDLSEAVHYEEFKEIIDIQSLMDLLILEFYLELWDFPEQNVKLWNTNEQPWSWIFNDGDTSMHEYWKSKMKEILLSENDVISDLFFTKMTQAIFKNESFRQAFHARFIHHLNHTLSPENVISKIDSLQVIYDPLMPEHISRWTYPNTINDYHAAVEHIRQFALLRPATLFTELTELFGVPFTIYPNPTTAQINIDFHSDFDIPTGMIFQLTNVAGRTIEQGIIHTSMLDISSLSTGVYFVTVLYEGVWYSEKVIKF